MSASNQETSPPQIPNRLAVPLCRQMLRGASSLGELLRWGHLIAKANDLSDAARAALRATYRQEASRLGANK